MGPSLYTVILSEDGETVGVEGSLYWWGQLLMNQLNWIEFSEVIPIRLTAFAQGDDHL